MVLNSFLISSLCILIVNFNKISLVKSEKWRQNDHEETNDIQVNDDDLFNDYEVNEDVKTPRAEALMEVQELEKEEEIGPSLGRVLGENS